MNETDEFKKEAKEEFKKLLESYACLSCRRRVGIDELYGAFGMCSTCLATEGFDEHDGG